MVGNLKSTMKKLTFLFIFLLFYCCQDYGKLNVVTDLPSKLKEVSGTETVFNSDLIWMLNDSGNKPELYGVTSKGKIKKVVKIQAKNHDWEDLTSDDEGNIYIGDFGNNESRRKNLVILKVAKDSLINNKKVAIERIRFSYPNQTKFPPKKKKRFFDAEAFFYLNNYLYIFTKSRVKHQFGKTSLYRIPATEGSHTAEFISEFNNCNDLQCWITSADITEDGKKIALLTHNEVLVFSNFKDDNFFKGNLKVFPLEHTSQKESITFKDENTLLITDERSHGSGGKLYKFKLNMFIQ